MEYYPEKMQHHGGLGFREYVKALEEERLKIQVFQRELPLCLELVTQAIEACRQQLSGTTTENNMHVQSESSEQTTSNDVPPVVEEFFPIKRSASSDDDEEEQQSHQTKKERVVSSDSKKELDWLRSVQLWNNPASDPQPKEEVPRKAAVMEVKRNGGGGGAFHPFQREKSVGKSNASVGKAPSSPAPEPTPEPAPVVAVATTTSSSVETATGGSGGNGRREEKEGQAQRKQRRNWSPELHRRFLHALQQLGGSQAATPKQIRELMKVDGLTNDEVKSHLQKYRLHTRRPSPTIHNNGNQQPQQVVVVGGIWVPATEYAAVAASGEVGSVAAANGIYTPVAGPPPKVQQAPPSQIQRLQQKQYQCSESEERLTNSEKRACSNSPATSSSAHTTTTTPVF